MMARPNSSAETEILGNFGRLPLPQWAPQAIAPSDHSLQVPRFVGVIGQGAADLSDGGIDALFDIGNTSAPQLTGDLLARDQLAPLLART
jgi:hypothetical protein